MKVFISQPMKNKTNEQIKQEREKAIADIAMLFPSENNINIIDSFFEDAPIEAKPLWFLGKSLELLSTADVAYFTSGWEEARGCKIERLCAEEYGIMVVDYNDI